MGFVADYGAAAPERKALDESTGALLVEFGVPWCGHCRRAQPAIEAALAAYPAVRHIKVEDGPGRRLGRTFGVKLWPALVFLRDGAVVAQLVRPDDEAAIRAALAQIDR